MIGWQFKMFYIVILFTLFYIILQSKLKFDLNNLWWSLRKETLTLIKKLLQNLMSITQDGLQSNWIYLLSFLEMPGGTLISTDA